MSFAKYEQTENAQYDESDHETWSKLYARQLELIGEWPCREWFEGLKKLGLDSQKVPDQQQVSRRLQELTGWKIFNAKNAFLNNDEWFNALAKKTFPATTYIRSSDELDFTPHPDLFHEYFGHLPLIANPQVARVAELFAKAYFATAPYLRPGVGRMWWHLMEWGFVKQDGQEKVFGGGTIAGKNDFLDALNTPRKQFSLQTAFNTKKVIGGVQGTYFVVESLDAIEKTLEAYVAQARENQGKAVELADFDVTEEIDEFRKSQS